MRRLDGVQGYTRWTAADDAELLRQVEAGVPYRDLSVPGHTPGSTKIRYRRRGLKCTERLSTGRLQGATGEAPTRKPTVKDVYWAAGFYDGEGSCIYVDHGIRATASQKGPELLERMKALFGGSVKVGYWYAGGARAAGFLMTIHPLLSTRRQEQVQETLAAWRA